MKLAVSNIAWTVSKDPEMYERLKEYGYCGLEIAPTRILGEHPYDDLDRAKNWQEEFTRKYGFSVPSMQSIWYGRSENLFASKEEYDILLAYTKKAIDFAEALHCENLVFGCPKGRNVPEGKDASVGIAFFKELGEYAYEHHTVIGMEANPTLYGTNYMNGTKEVLELIERVDSKGFRLNLDLGTMIYNEESAALLRGKISLINHVHISEPGLKAIEPRPLHGEIAKCLRDEGYDRFVSVEMGNAVTEEELLSSIEYVKSIFA